MRADHGRIKHLHQMRRATQARERVEERLEHPRPRSRQNRFHTEFQGGASQGPRPAQQAGVARVGPNSAGKARHATLFTVK